MKGVAILGSTGSIGLNTLDVIARHPGEFRAAVLTARASEERLFEQCAAHRPDLVVLVEEAAARRLGERAGAEGVESHCESAKGVADDCIVERGQRADLLVLGRDGQHVAHHSGLVGSTANGVLHKTQKPSLVVPSAAQLGGPILLAFDGSAGSRVGAEIAVQLATRTAEAIHVFVDSKDKGRAQARFQEVHGLVGALPVPVREISSTLGRPDVKIIDSAREIRAGVIVMGAYGRNRITDYFLGSNAAAVVRTSPIAVLLAR